MAVTKLMRPWIMLAVIAGMLFGAVITPLGPAPQVSAAEAPVTFEAPATANGLTLKYVGGDGKYNTDPIGGRNAVQFTDDYGYFDVDNAYMFGNYPVAAVQVTYYDQGTGYFFVQYDSAGKSNDPFTNSYDNAGRLFLNNSQQWITGTIYLHDVQFTNGQFGLSDFRIAYLNQSNPARAANIPLAISRVAVTRGMTMADLPGYQGATSVSLAAPGAPDGLSLVNIGVADTAISSTTVDGRSAIEVSANGYAYFDVDNSFIYQGKTASGTGTAVSDVQVEVSYYDRGYGFFYLQWDSTATAIPAGQPSQSFNNGLRSDNVVYLKNTNTWVTYTFNLPNVYFGDRNILGNYADFRITYPMNIGTDAEIANMGNRLAFDRVTVRRSATPLDQTGALNGAGPNGDQVVVWTRLAQVNDRGHGLYQIEGNGAAATTATTIPVGDSGAGTNTTQVRQASSGSISFDVNDNYIKNGNAYDVFVGVEYYDDSFGSFILEYDAGAANRYKQTSSIASAGSNTLKRTFFYLPDAYFGNGQAGGADFRIRASSNSLKVKSVYVERTIGTQVQPRGTVNTSAISSFSKTQRVVAAHYFPVFDGYYPSLWETSTMGPPGANATTHILNSYSWRSISTLKKDLEDARDAGIDVLPVWYDGSTAGASFGSVRMVQNLVAAAQQVSNPPKLAILLDPIMLYHESFLKAADTTIDLTDSDDKALFTKMAVDFFSIVPTDLWAAIDGRPVVFVYYQDTSNVSQYDATMFDTLRNGFQRDFGIQPYLIADNLYDPTGSRGVSVDEFFSWGAGHCDSCVNSAPGYAQNNVMEIGPGFNDGARVRDREDGQFYARSWQRAIAKGMHLVAIDTFNYWVEGAAIANSDLYGTKYLDLTKQYATEFKQKTYGSATSVNTTLGTSNLSNGIYLDTPRGGGGDTSVVTKGGLEGRTPAGNNMFFSIDDSFLFDVPNGTSIQIAVTYWDEAPTADQDSFFDLNYDGQSNAFTSDPNRYRQVIQHSGTWKTATFTLTDAAFRNRQDEKNDFMLSAPNGALVVRSIQVTRPASMVSKVSTSPGGLRLDFGVGSQAVVPVTRTLQVVYTDNSAQQWTASDDKAWLTLSATSGTSPQTIVLTIDPTKLSSTYDIATITFTSATGLETKVLVYARIGEAPYRISLPRIVATYSISSGW